MSCCNVPPRNFGHGFRNCDGSTMHVPLILSPLQTMRVKIAAWKESKRFKLKPFWEPTLEQKIYLTPPGPIVDAVVIEN